MKILLLTNKSHQVALEAIKFLKKKIYTKIQFEKARKISLNDTEKNILKKTKVF
tara:strand:+ start:1877 stop:2038 length:162 start_codon:yes stop_codon:yes gene_type:complete